MSEEHIVLVVLAVLAGAAWAWFLVTIVMMNRDENQNGDAA